MKGYSETLKRTLAPLDELEKMGDWDKYDNPDQVVSNHFRVWCKEHKDWEKHDVYIKNDGTLWHIEGLNQIPLNLNTHVICWDTNHTDVNGNVILLYDRVRSKVNDFYGTSFEGIVKRLVYEKQTHYVIEFDRTVECKVACHETDYLNGIQCIKLHGMKLEVIGSEFEIANIQPEEGITFCDDLQQDDKELRG